MTAPIDIVKSFYDALGRGDVPAALSFYSPGYGIGTSCPAMAL